MQNNSVGLIANQFFKKTFINKGLLLLLVVFVLAVLYVTITSWSAFTTNQAIVENYQEETRKSWESNPDKHPHRMAHFGTFVFRQQHPLSIFDSGIESYTGNSIFLESHRQNTANFSEASLSTGLIRFGDLNIAMLLQLILPLILFFIGYSSISSEKENGTLKMIYMQGAKMNQILLGKAIGLFLIACLFFLPALFALWSIVFLQTNAVNSEVVLRSILLSISYVLFFMILCGVTVLISAKSRSSNKALLSLLGIWLLFFIITPKTAQAIGNYMHPNPSKMEFQATIEAEVSKQGDSHNPDDPYFNNLKDSVLLAHNVTDVNDLPFNYSGFIMSKGEEQTSKIYKDEYAKLIKTYRSQNGLTSQLVWLNPYLAVKKGSMALSGSDFDTYVSFLNQTDEYRYVQSQHMNDLQMEFISNKAKSSEGTTHVVKKEYWASFPRFQYEYNSVSSSISKHLLPIGVLFLWLFGLLLIMTRFSNQFKVM